MTSWPANGESNFFRGKIINSPPALARCRLLDRGGGGGGGGGWKGGGILGKRPRPQRRFPFSFSDAENQGGKCWIARERKIAGGMEAIWNLEGRRKEPASSSIDSDRREEEAEEARFLFPPP